MKTLRTLFSLCLHRAAVAVCVGALLPLMALAQYTGGQGRGDVMVGFLPPVLSAIATDAIPGSPFCAGATLNVPYTATGIFNPGNVFTAELSDASGVFPPIPTVIGSVSATTSGSISCTIDPGTLAGSAFRIRVVSSDPAITGTDNGSDLSVLASPTPTASNTGPFCEGQSVILNGTAGGGFIFGWSGPNGPVSTGINANLGPATPTMAGLYTFSSSNGTCTGTATTTVVVNPLPIVNCPSNGIVCVSAPAFALAGGSPGGGTYSGPGVSGGNFDPASAGVGIHTILYTYSDGNLCTNTCTFTITVNSPPSLSATITPASCPDQNDGAIDLLVTGGSGTPTFDWTSDLPCAVDNQCPAGLLCIPGPFTCGRTNTVEDLAGLPVGTYTVTVTMGGCSVTEAFVVGSTSPDSDADGTLDCEDDCPLAVNGIANFNTTTCACELGFFATTTVIGPNTVITACTICPPGSYCPDGLQAISCPAGYFSASFGQIVCNACSAGTFSALTGSTACQSCAAGTFNATTAATECLSCPAGTFSAVTGSVECQSCAAGSFSATTGSTVCESCPAGSFSDVIGSVSCTSCPAGSFSATTGSTVCESCPAGSFSDVVGSVECTSCPAGSFSATTGSTVCESCPAGSFSDVVGSVECTSCPAGSFSATTGSTVCASCPAGSFSDVSGSVSCTSCPAGSFSATTGSTVCESCPAGSFSDVVGSIECASCPAGSFSSTIGSIACASCPAGTFSAVTGSIACTPCAAGFANNTTAATSCSACPPGSFSANSGQAVCNLCPVNTYNPFSAQTSCLACPNGETSTVGSVACVPDGPCTDVILEFQTDGNPDQTTWEVRSEDGTTVIASGGPLVAPFGIQTDMTCLPDGCYTLRVLDSFGDGMTTGGYILRTVNGERIIDDRNNFSTGSVSAISGGQGFCLPMSSDKVIFTSCDKLDWIGGQYVVATPNAAVSAQWLTGVQTDDGYEFWIFDPNGTYSFRRFRNHATSDLFGPASATRACHMKLNNWTLANHVPANVLMNVRVRARVNGVNGAFGPACRLAINPALAACPQTQLMNVPGDPNFSCGATRQWGTGNLVHARPVSGANRYQFRFRIVAEGFSVTRTATTYFTQLNWAVLPLQDGKTYDVDVRVSKDAGATWCSASDPWGPVCQLTIDNTPANNGNQNFAAEGADGELRMFPNPNRGDVLNFSLSAIAEGVNTVSVDIYELTGKRISARTIAVTDGNVNTVLDLQGELAAGMYLVNITAGDRTYTERLVIQP